MTLLRVKQINESLSGRMGTRVVPRKIKSPSLGSMENIPTRDGLYFIFSQKGKRNHERKIGQHYEKCALSD
ncbi:unknown [Roseburia sp. CAG:309]|nr:unknown [Roseburia sp. CAG:309]